MKRRLLILSLIAAPLSIGLAYFFAHIDLIPRPASLEREAIDGLLKTLFSIASVFFVVIMVVFLDSVIFFRRRRGDSTDGPPVRGYTPLEVAWTLIPLAIVVAMGIVGGQVLHEMQRPAPPQSELEINVLAFRFGWQFEYVESGVKSFDLQLPVNRRVMLHMQSRDVVHGFWVPEFGPKQDIVPGMTTEMSFTPTWVGQYTVFCSQLCGAGHTYMMANAAVVSASDFEKWLQEQLKQAK